MEQVWGRYCAPAYLGCCVASDRYSCAGGAMSGFLAGVGGWVAMLFAALVIAIVLGGFVWYLSVALL
jgi:hypothetical protein